jgi:hypothetical protein
MESAGFEHTSLQHASQEEVPCQLESNPHSAPQRIHRSLWWYAEGGGKWQYCTAGNWGELNDFGAVSVFECISSRSCLYRMKRYVENWAVRSWIRQFGVVMVITRSAGTLVLTPRSSWLGCGGAWYVSAGYKFVEGISATAMGVACV